MKAVTARLIFLRCLSSCFPCVTRLLDKLQRFPVPIRTGLIPDRGTHSAPPPYAFLTLSSVLLILPKESLLLQPGRPLKVTKQAVISPVFIHCSHHFGFLLCCFCKLFQHFPVHFMISHHRDIMYPLQSIPVSPFTECSEPLFSDQRLFM